MIMFDVICTCTQAQLCERNTGGISGVSYIRHAGDSSV